jgi:hypothetical protein
VKSQKKQRINLVTTYVNQVQNEFKVDKKAIAQHLSDMFNRVGYDNNRLCAWEREAIPIPKQVRNYMLECVLKDAIEDLGGKPPENIELLFQMIKI